MKVNAHRGFNYGLLLKHANVLELSALYHESFVALNTRGRPVIGLGDFLALICSTFLTIVIFLSTDFKYALLTLSVCSHQSIVPPMSLSDYL